MPWAAWAGAGPFCTSWGARAGLAHCGWAPMAAWGCIQLPCRGADAELSPPRAAARVDPAVPLQLRAGNGVSRGRRAPQRERRGCRAGCGLAAGWGGRGRGQGQGAMLCTLGGSVSAAACQGPDAPGAAGSWARCVCSADMVGLALFLGDELGSAWKRGLGEGRAAGRCCLEPVPLPGSHRMDSGCPGETLPQCSEAVPGAQGTGTAEAMPPLGWVGRGGGHRACPGCRGSPRQSASLEGHFQQQSLASGTALICVQAGTSNVPLWLPGLPGSGVGAWRGA